MFDLQPIDLIVKNAVARIAARASRSCATSVFMSRDGVPATANDERFHYICVFPVVAIPKRQAGRRKARV